MIDADLIIDALALAAGASVEREAPATRDRRERRQIARFRRDLMRFLDELPGEASVAEIRESLEASET